VPGFINQTLTHNLMVAAEMPGFQLKIESLTAKKIVMKIDK